MLALMRSWGVTWGGSGLAALGYTFGAPILFQYCNIIYLVGAAWLPLGFLAIDKWVRFSRRMAILELAIVLAMQVLGGDPQAAFLLGVAGLGYAVGLHHARATRARPSRQNNGGPAATPSSNVLLLTTGIAVIVLWFLVTIGLCHCTAEVPRSSSSAADAPPALDAVGAFGRERFLAGSGRIRCPPLARPCLEKPARHDVARNGSSRAIGRRSHRGPAHSRSSSSLN